MSEKKGLPISIHSRKAQGKVLEILEACEDENELVDYVDGVTLIKKFEWLFTVKQLFEHIRPV